MRLRGTELGFFIYLSGTTITSGPSMVIKLGERDNSALFQESVEWSLGKVGSEEWMKQFF